MHQSFSFFLSHMFSHNMLHRLALHLHWRQGPLPAGANTLPSAYTFLSNSHSADTNSFSQFQTKQWCLNPKCKSDESTLFPHLCMWDSTLLCAWLDVYSVAWDTRRPSAHRTLHCPDPKSRDGIKCFMFKGAVRR